MSDKPRGTTAFGNDQKMIDRVKARTAVPVGGAPMPKVPRLDQAPPDRSVGVQNASSARRVMTPKEQQKLAESGKMIPGVGSAYAGNQPGLANLPTDDKGETKEIDERLIPRPPGSGLRPETVDDLNKLAAVQDAKKEDEELDQINKEIDDLDDEYVTDEFGNRVKSLLANKERKKAIESRCMPMDFDTLLMEGSIDQRVPIIPGKFEPTFRSTHGHEDDFLNERMAVLRGSDRQVMDRFTLYRLTCGLVKINNRVLPTHLGANGKTDEKLFDAKFDMVVKLATQILADLSVNYNWFMRRVEKLLVFDNIKDF
jgi:hypothetical protein